MKTSSVKYDGPGRIAICRSVPRGMKGGYRIYSPLKPGPWFNSAPRPEYDRLYAAILADLDPAEEWARLHELAAGAEPVLLCWERPHDLASGKCFCHRRMAAKWFETNLGVTVPELGFENVVGTVGNL